MRKGVFSGCRVLELCSTIAGPVCARLFADFGAEVIKIEPPTGDPVRQMDGVKTEDELFSSSLLRNKESVIINLKTEKGAELVTDMVACSDIIIENFRPGTMERLGLGYDVLAKINPRLIMVRISGYGQTGPKAKQPGYGAICEAYAGVRHMTGDPDRPPARVALAVTDYLTAVYAAFGASMALLHREKSGVGQIVDMALYEGAFSMMEQVTTAYSKMGVIPSRQGSRLAGMAPNSLYEASDETYVLIAANNDATFSRLASAMGMPHIIDDPKFCSIKNRSINCDEVDKIVDKWAAKNTGAKIVNILTDHDVPVSLVNRISDIFDEDHFKARSMLEEIDHPSGGRIVVPGLTPKMSVSPGEIIHAGPPLGADTKKVLRRILNITKEDLELLEKENVIIDRSA